MRLINKIAKRCTKYSRETDLSRTWQRIRTTGKELRMQRRASLNGDTGLDERVVATRHALKWSNAKTLPYAAGAWCASPILRRVVVHNEWGIPTRTTQRATAPERFTVSGDDRSQRTRELARQGQRAPRKYMIYFNVMSSSFTLLIT